MPDEKRILVRMTGRKAVRVEGTERSEGKYYVKNDIVEMNEGDAQRMVNTGAAEFTEESAQYIRSNESELDAMRKERDDALAALDVAEKNFAIMKTHYESVKGAGSAPVQSLTGETVTETATNPDTPTVTTGGGKPRPIKE